MGGCPCALFRRGFGARQTARREACPDTPSEDAVMLMDVLARGGAPDLEVLDGFVDDKPVIWTPHAKWLLEKKVMGACPKLHRSSTRWRSALCPVEDEW